MKFKKIEIQAFRAYNKVEDGTFDFTTKSNEVADFISIYAPNGFGKTSFYDAVEWGFTNNIGRFLRRKDDNKNSAKVEESNYILRNKFANANTESIVRLYTTLQEQPFEQKIGKLRSNQRDFKFDEKETNKEREYFQQVLLSQEWIDAFLKEDDASIRYEKFIKSFGDINLDQKYKTLVELIKHNSNKIGELSQELQNLQRKINFDFDHEVLLKINSEIEILNNNGEKIPVVQFDWTEKHIQQLADLISARITDLRYNLGKYQEKITTTNSAITGNNISNINIELYFSTKERIKQLDDNLLAINKIKKQFSSIHDFEKIKKNKEEVLHKTIQEQSIFLEILSIYPKYIELNKEILATNNSINKIDNELKIIDFELGTRMKSYNEIDVKLNSEIENNRKLSTKLTTIPELAKELNTKNAEKSKTLELIDSSLKTSFEYEQQIKSISAEIKEWEEIVNQLAKDNYQILANDLAKPFNESIKRIFLNLSLINETRKALIKTESEIENANRLNADIEQLITKGADIVSKSQSSVCPLCKQEYQNFELLIQKITSNSFLSERMKNILALKNKNEKELESLINQQNQEKNSIINAINSNVNGLKNKLAKETSTKNELLKAITGHKSNVQMLDNEISKLLKEIGGDDIEVIKVYISEKIKESSHVLNELKVSKEKNIQERLPLEQRRKVIIEHEKPDFEVKINELKKDSSFVRFKNFMSENQIVDEDIDFELNKRKENYQTKIKTENEEIVNHTRSIIEYQKLLEKHDEAAVISDIKQLENEKEALTQKVVSFEYFIKSELEFELLDKEKDELIKFLNSSNDSYKTMILQTEERIQSFEKMKGYKESVLPFLRHEEYKRKEKTILANKSFFEKIVHPKLDQERKQISEYIDRQIESFFHGKLINSLYQKIDPHPVYKEVKFSCDFNTDKPRLNVFVVGEKGSTPIIPTLYFSTAQLNILSLSIFLAKALNVKDKEGQNVDCIFIDDPVQSMDSINILSTIDLLRSIAVNMGKQIVLATHDENFHHLLQKKIPSDKFRAKYIELETFGKVKHE